MEFLGIGSNLELLPGFDQQILGKETERQTSRRTRNLRFSMTGPQKRTNQTPDQTSGGMTVDA